MACEKNRGAVEEQPSLHAGSSAPDFILKTLDGRDVKLSEYKGNVVLVEFWATWCPPCRASVPELISIQDKYKNKGFVILGVSVDEGQNLVAKLTDFTGEFRINYPILLGNEDVARAYNVRSIPTSFLVDKDGKIVTWYMGYTDQFESSIASQLAKLI